MIKRYEDRNEGAPGPIANLCVENNVENPEIESLSERVKRMPTSDDPGLWSVRVQVSLCTSLEESAI